MVPPVLWTSLFRLGPELRASFVYVGLRPPRAPFQRGFKIYSLPRFLWPFWGMLDFSSFSAVSLSQQASLQEFFLGFHSIKKGSGLSSRFSFFYTFLHLSGVARTFLILSPSSLAFSGVAYFPSIPAFPGVVPPGSTSPLRSVSTWQLFFGTVLGLSFRSIVS